MPDVRTFRAATMREALDRVRTELGREAVILATRQVPVRRLLPWGQREEVEITAGLGIATKPVVAKRETPQEHAVSRAPRVAAPAAPRLNESERRAAEIVKELQRRDFDGPLSAAIAGMTNRLDVVTPDDSTTLRAASRPTRHQASPVEGPATDLSKRLDAIERLLSDLGRRHRAAAEVPADLLGHYDRLVAAEVEGAMAQDLLNRLHEQVPAARLADPATVRSALIGLVESELRCGGPITVNRGVRKVVALVGPTGVGKTTTLAKLAANFRLRDGLRTGLVTVDTYRIAAVEQLRTYAEIIDLPMKVVATPAEMRAALDELPDLDLVLIDTAGRSPRDAKQIAELGELLAAARPDETHLVLSLTAGRTSLARSIKQFRPVAPTALIATKLDEIDGPGPLLALGRDEAPALSYVTTGQDVPDDIEPARLDGLARRIVDASRGETRAAREKEFSP